MTTQKPVVSIIVPVYNVERYLDACLDSATNQSYRHLEIILVDDGSTDSSGTLCDAWAKKDSRIKVVHKKNEGLNYARKSGWEVAEGYYVTFLDSDDIFHQDNIKNSLGIMLKNNLDMVVYTYLSFSDLDEKKSSISPRLSEGCDIGKSPAEALTFLLRNGYESMYPMTAWGKLYKKKLVDQVDWEQSNMRAYEDNFFTPQIFSNVKTFAIVKQQLYFYRNNETGEVLSKMLTGNHRNGKSIGYLEYMNVLKDYWLELFEKHKLDLKEEMDDFWLGNMHFRLDNLLKAGLLCEENNVEYISSIITAMQRKTERDITNHNKVINDQAETISQLEGKVETVETLKLELARLETLSGSLQNVASKVKRKVLKRKG